MQDRSLCTPSTGAGTAPSGKASIRRPDVETLRRFRQIRQLSEEAITKIAAHASVNEVPPSQALARLGTRSNVVLFLIEGRLLIKAADGAQHEIESDTEDAEGAVSFLQPHRYTVTSSSPALVLFVNREMLDKLSNKQNDATFEVEEVYDGCELRDSLLFHELYQNCSNDNLKLPSLPDIAIRVRKAIEDEDWSIDKVSWIIESDPAITAKLIKVSNSVMYCGQTPVDTTVEALVRLGMRTTLQLVTSFSMRELYSTRSKYLQAHMERLWNYSIEIAATCYVVATRMRGFNRETALLAGLLDDVGGIAIVTQAEKYPEIANSPNELERVIEKLHADVGGMMLRSWGFPEKIAMVPNGTEDWYHTSKETPDYCNVVLWAKLLQRLKQAGDPKVPPLEELPFLSALDLCDPTIESVLEFAEQYEEKISKMRAVLGG